MSEHTYTPKSKFGKWINDSLPLLSLASSILILESAYEFPSFLEDKYWIILKLLFGKLMTISPN